MIILTNAVRPIPPVAPVVTGITLTPATGTASSASGTIVGTLTAIVTGGALVNPVWTLLSTAGGDFQLVNGNQVAFLPANVPAGSYTVRAQVSSSNAATFPATASDPANATITVEAQSVTTAPMTTGKTPIGGAAPVVQTGPLAGPALTLSTNAAFGTSKFAKGLSTGAASTASFTTPADNRAVGFWVRGPVAQYSTFLQILGMASFGTADNGRFETDSSGNTTTGGNAPSTSYSPGIFLNDTADHWVYWEGGSGNNGAWVDGVMQTSGGAAADSSTVSLHLDTAILGSSGCISDIQVWNNHDASRAPPPTARAVVDSNTVALWPLNGDATSLAGRAPIAAFTNVNTPVSNETGAFPTTFNVTNFATQTSSTAVMRRGVWFRDGDVPAGSYPTLSGAAGQFYAFTRWPSGALKQARLLMRDDTGVFAALEHRAYTLASATGVIPYTAVAANGNAGLAAMLGAFDPVKVLLTQVVDSNGAQYGSGAFTLDLNSHAGKSTRWTKLSDGPVATVFQGWGMATDTAGGAIDAHLKVNWYVVGLKNPDGTYFDIEATPELALNWWGVPGKQRLNYTAELRCGAKSITIFTGVAHIYQSNWAMVVADGSYLTGQPFWMATPRSTLHFNFDRKHLIATGLTSNLNLGTPNAGGSVPAYTPCGSMEHRANVDGTGSYPGRGALTVFDGNVLQIGDAQSYARADANALAGLGVPYHYRSDDLRTRPGETADVANTVLPLLCAPQPASYTTFPGLPTPVDAYNDGRCPASAQHGYVQAVGGSGVWGPSADCSHAVTYSFFMALLTGFEWLAETCQDLATKTAHTLIYGYHENVPPFVCSFNSAAPKANWTGLSNYNQTDNPRAMGWPQVLLAHGEAATPDDHVAAPYFKAWLDHHDAYLTLQIGYMPPQWVAGGVYQPNGSSSAINETSPWAMSAMIGIGAYASYNVHGRAGSLALGDFVGEWAYANIREGAFYALDMYRAMLLAKATFYDPNTNPVIPAGSAPFIQIGGNLDASSGMFTMYGLYFNASNPSYPPPMNGDAVIFTVANQSGATNSTNPSGIVDGQKGYMVNVQGSASAGFTFQFSDTQGGAAKTWTTSGSYNAAWRGQSFVQATAGSPLYLPDNSDAYIPLFCQMFGHAAQAKTSKVTADMKSKLTTFTAPMRPFTYAPHDVAW